MDASPFIPGKSGRQRRLSRPGTALHWLQRHPLVSAVMYMLVGGGLVYVLLANKSSHQLAPTSAVVTDQQPAAPATWQQLPEAPAVFAAPPAPSTVTPAAAPAQQDVLCQDTCFKAKDGVCDDGRFVKNMTRGLGSRVLCDLGTDCSDCGIWKGLQHSNSWTEEVGPVEYLRRANLTIITKRAIYDPKFYFAYTDPAHDVDQSFNYNGLGVVEPRLTHIAYHLLHGPCQRSGDGVMLDVGANFGWFSILAGMLGCRVIAWEPVTTFRAFLEYSIARNKLQHKIEVRPAAVVQFGSSPGEANYTVVAPQRGMWGTASIDGKNIQTHVDNEGEYHRYNVTGETLDQLLLLPEELKKIALLKIDVEGYEPRVIAGASQLLKKQLVDNILMEYAPTTIERHDITSLDQLPRMLLSLIAAGFKIGHIEKTEFVDRAINSLSEPLEMLPAVTETNLKFDLFDCMQLTEKGHMWLRVPCREMTSMKLIGEGIPERLHPKSFRSAFDGFTHVWASRDPKYVPYLAGPAVGAFPAERKLSGSWFIPEWSDAGMGARSCKNLKEVAATDQLSPAARASLLVSHRCRCGTAQPCEKEEHIADNCAQAGQTPFNDDPNWVPDR